LGDGSTNDSTSPVSVDLGSGRTAISVEAGVQHTCAILDDASLKCWGNNGAGQLGIPGIATSNSPQSVFLGVNRTAIAIALGTTHTCAILDDNSLKCWGANGFGQLGIGNTTSQSSPQLVNMGSELKSVAITAASRHTCAILEDGSLKCWGANHNGQLGNHSDASCNQRNSPTGLCDYINLGSGRTAVSVSSSYRQTCVILDDGSLKCWGHNDNGQLGIGNTITQYSPTDQYGFYDTYSVDLGSGRSATSVSMGTSHTCATLDDASVKCWGYNWAGQLGLGNTTQHTSPQSVDLGTGLHNDLSERDIDGDGILNIFDTHMDRVNHFPVSGRNHWTCAALDNGSVYCWGLSSEFNSSAPFALDLPSERMALSVTTGMNHACSILDNGSVYCWGWNSYGQLGDGLGNCCVTTPVPVSLPSGRTATSVSAGTLHTCAVLDNGSAYCWGRDSSGQLGNGIASTSIQSTPVAVSLPSGRTASSVITGANNACSILDNGSVYCWGAGIGHSPVAVSLPIGSIASSFVSSGTGGTCVNLVNSSMYCWGINSEYFGIGTNNVNTPAVPTFPGGRTAISVSGSSTHICAVLDNASLYCEGNNDYGQLGDGSFTDSSTPVMVSLPSGRTASWVTVGEEYTCAVLDDDSLYCWGRGEDGELGHSTNMYSLTPVAVSLPTGRTVIPIDSDLDGDGFGDGNDDYPSNPARAVSCSAGSYGRYVCDEASPGYYVTSAASMYQDACPAGTYNTNTGSTSSSDCISTSAGHYSSPGSGSQTECAAGTYQSSTGQSSCIDASAGYFVPSTAATSQIGCAVGTYQPSTGQSSCIDTSAGYYVSSTASASQIGCAVGTYQPSTGQSSCIDASAGYYVSSNASTSQTACSTGTYQPNTGRTSCFVASVGHYVDSTGATSQTACAAGTYNPNSGSTSSSACLDTDAGYYSNSGASTQTACATGTYQPNTGRSSCLDAPVGAYVSGTAATSYSSCQGGAYQPNTGQTSCLTSEAGYYVPEPAFPVKVTDGVHHSCFLYDDGSVRCSGYNEMGQLGDGTTTSSINQVVVDLGGAIATDVSSGYWHTCALLSDGQILCWGQNTQGQLGDGSTNDSASPVSVNLGSGTTALQLSAGGRYTCALVQNSSIACWGQNAAGQLGDNSTLSSTSPVYPNLPAGRTAIEISAGASTTCAILDNASAAMCWGDGGGGRLGNDAQSSTPDSLVPVYVSLPSERTVTSISIGYYHGCAILDNGSAMCWGSAEHGAIGNGTGDPDDGSWSDSMNAWSPQYVSLPSGRTAESISAAREYTCAILDDDSIACWGDNEYGKIGDGTTVDRWSPVIVDVDSTFSPTNITTGYVTTCLVMSDLSVFCWGGNGHGEFGNGNNTNSQTPVLSIQPVGASAPTPCPGATYNSNTGSTNVSACIGASPGHYVPMPNGISAADSHSCAIDRIGDLYCWGSNSNGILGLGFDHNTLPSTYIPSKVNFSANRTVESVSLGSSHTCAILDNGSLNCWGTYFPLTGFNNSISASSSPVFIDPSVTINMDSLELIPKSIRVMI